MLKKSITYTDFDDTERTEDFYFAMSKFDLLELEASYKGGIQRAASRMREDEDNLGILELYKKIILKAYGKRSEDGKKFVKSKEAKEEFEQSAAFQELLFELILAEDAFEQFLIGALPSNVAAEYQKTVAEMAKSAPEKTETPSE